VASNKKTGNHRINRLAFLSVVATVDKVKIALLTVDNPLPSL
jgi:hypothetical protein